MPEPLPGKPIAAHSIVGVVCDVVRERENDYMCEKTCIFGIDQEEHAALTRAAEIRPTAYDHRANRFVAMCNPWTVMRVLGAFG